MTEAELETLVGDMSLEEQVSILSGADFWTVAGIERLGFGTLKVTDGPNGARGGGSLIGGVKSASFGILAYTLSFICVVLAVEYGVLRPANERSSDGDRCGRKNQHRREAVRILA